MTDGGSGALATSTYAENPPTDTVGTHAAHVYGSDWAGNVGTALCRYRVTYDFSFFGDVDAPPIVNTAKAGVWVPLFWAALDDDLNPVTDPSHLVGVAGKRVPCAARATSDALESTAKPGGLERFGDLAWRYPWKTLDSYQGTCQEVSISLDDATKHVVAIFRFH